MTQKTSHLQEKKFFFIFLSLFLTEKKIFLFFTAQKKHILTFDESQFSYLLRKRPCSGSVSP